jgi:uncharacterized protein
VILIDANILLYAYDPASQHHAACRDWFQRQLSESGAVALPWQSILAFVRIATNPRAVRQAISAQRACHTVDAWLARPNVVTPGPGLNYWATLKAQMNAARVQGPLVSDAALAALALELGATLCTTDRDFRRFEGLQLFDPTTGAVHEP